MPQIKHFHSVAELAAAFRYDPETGILYRRLPNGSERHCGSISRSGHLRVSVSGHDVGAHRIAWALYHGEFPKLGIDHINCNSSDNRIINLRLATDIQNGRNRRIAARNKIGVKNIYRVKCRKRLKWRVSMGLGNSKEYEAHFHCLGKAVKHAAKMRIELYGEFARAS
jgi:hypothetical protein